MLNYGNIIGNQEDWANFVTNVESSEAPFVSWLPVGDKPVNVLHQYQAEKFRDPVDNAHINGTPVSGFLSAGDSRGVLKALVQYFTKAAAITTLHEEVSDIAGIADEFARELDKCTTELTFDIEAAFLEDADHQADDTTKGYKTRGVGSWISSSAQTLYPVPEDFRPPAASVITTATASITENSILDVLQSMAGTARMARPVTAFMGPSAKRMINGFALFTPASALVGGTPTGRTGVVSNLTGTATQDRVVERYLTDFGTVDFNISYRIVAFDTNTVSTGYGTYFLHRDMWQLRWNMKPQWHRKEYEGGAYEAFTEAICMLVCKSPRSEGKWLPTA